MTLSRAIEELETFAGRQFDPQLVKLVAKSASIRRLLGRIVPLQSPPRRHSGSRAMPLGAPGRSVMSSFANPFCTIVNRVEPDVSLRKLSLGRRHQPCRKRAIPSLNPFLSISIFPPPLPIFVYPLEKPLSDKDRP